MDDLLLVAERDCRGEPLNLASDVNHTVREAVKLVLAVTGHAVEPQYDPTKPTAIPYRALATRRFENLFGPRTRKCLQEGLRRTIEWYRRQSATV